jgi:DNA modification methylase
MNTNTIQQQLLVNTILNGNCIEKMRQMPANSIDFILTDRLIW